jgi:hypothetical protein
MHKSLRDPFMLLIVVFFLLFFMFDMIFYLFSLVQMDQMKFMGPYYDQIVSIQF